MVNLFIYFDKNKNKCSNFHITAVIPRVSKEKEKSYRNGNLTRSHVNKCDRIVFDTAWDLKDKTLCCCNL